MNVLYTCDNNYVWIMGISMISLFENNKEMNQIVVYLLGDNVSQKNKDTLKDIANKYNRKCVIVDIPELNIPDVLCSQRWPKSAFSRLYAGELLPDNVEKVLYLDCDTIVKNSIRELWNVDNSDFVISGVKDCISRQYRKNIGIPDTAAYINAGVLLMNLNLLRKTNISKRIDSFLNKYQKFIHYADQDVLNGIFKGNFGILNSEYDLMTLVCTYSYNEIIKLRNPSNYYSKIEIEKAKENTKIIHYTTCMLSVRPWFENSEHPYANDFLKYMKLSPWKEKNLLKESNKKSKKNEVLRVVFKMPKGIRYSLIGLVHSKLFPYYIKIKAMRGKNN